MSIIHVFADYPHHVIPMVGFFQSIHNKENDDLFYIHARNNESIEKYKGLMSDNTFCYQDFDKLIRKLKVKRNDTILFHSLFDYEQWLCIVKVRFQSRIVWVNWGAELYKHTLKEFSNTSFKKRLKKEIELWLKRFAMLKLDEVLALNNGDAQLIRSKFWRRKVTTLPYPIIGFYIQQTTSRPRILTQNECNQHTLNIFCGNSGAPSNNHIKMLASLRKFKEENIHITVPLNYGASKEYCNEVITYGKLIFGDKFTPITTMLDKVEYDDLLEKMDIGVFFHERQQGLYVAYSFLLQGKLMYLNDKTSYYRDFCFLGLKIGCANNIDSNSFADFIRITEADSIRNKEISSENFCEEALRPRWQAFLLKQE